MRGCHPFGLYETLVLDRIEFNFVLHYHHRSDQETNHTTFLVCNRLLWHTFLVKCQKEVAFF